MTDNGLNAALEDIVRDEIESRVEIEDQELLSDFDRRYTLDKVNNAVHLIRMAVELLDEADMELDAHTALMLAERILSVAKLRLQGYNKR